MVKHLRPIGRLVDEVAVRDQFAVSWGLALAATRALALGLATLWTLGWLSTTGSGAHLLFAGVAEIRAGLITELPELPAVTFVTVSCAFGTTFAEQRVWVPGCR